MRIAIAAAVLAFAAPAWADVIHLANGGRLEGVVVRETDAHYVIRLKYATVTLPKSDVASIEKKEEPKREGAAARLAKWDKCIEIVAPRPWAAELRQIPATVIDKGVLKNVPYMSFKSGSTEFNVYGDPDAPACLEIGVTKELLKSDAAKKECLAVMLALLSDAKDQELLKSLDVRIDKKERDGLTFEVTPETAEDAYGGWWISIYDAKALDAVRATEKELLAITVTEEEEEAEEKAEKEEEQKIKEQQKKDPKVQPPKKSQEQNLRSVTRWVTPDFKHARPMRSAQRIRRVYVRGYSRSGGAWVGPVWRGGVKK
jgi:hypothetical protein